MENLWKLCKLQKIDLELREKEKEKESLDNGEKALLQINQAANKNNEFKEKVKDLKSKAKKLEQETQTLEEQIKTIEKQLYSNRNTGPKELMNWQQEIEHIKTQKRKFEDEMLNYMEEIEVFENKTTVGDRLIEKARQNQEEVVKEYNLRLGEINKKLAEINDQRTVVLEGIDEDMLTRYELLRERKDGIALVKINGNACGGCFISLPKNIVEKTKLREEIYCSNCGRLLYWE